MLFLGIVPIGFLVLVACVVGLVMLVISPGAFVLFVIILGALVTMLVRHRIGVAREARARLEEERQYRHVMMTAALRSLEQPDRPVWKGETTR